MSIPNDGADRGLDEIAENDRRLAHVAEHEADLERPVAAGRPDHPHPDIAAADHVRARDDVRTYERQSDAASAQAAAAETLADNAARLEESRARLAEVRADARERAGDVRGLADDAREGREQARDVLETARDIQPPQV